MYFLQVLIYLWGIPLNRSSEIIQCTSFLKYGKDGDSGLLTQELICNILGGFIIVLTVFIILMNCCTRIDSIGKNS